MRSFRSLLFACAALLACALPALAQTMGAPPILLLQYEYVKPGHGGAAHAATESAFVKAFTDAKFPSAYLGMESLSGNNRALFLTGYSSFADYEKDFKTVSGNPLLGLQIDNAMAHDGEHLSEAGQSFYALDKSLSHSEDKIDAGTARYWEITRIKVKPGHEHEFDELAKMYNNATMKLNPGEIWAAYSSVYGNENGGIWMFFVPLKSLADVDTMMNNGDKLPSAMGEGGMKKFAELEAASVDSMSTNLFAVNPKMSYPMDGWVKSDPAFWNGK
jgi:hypothetical protein